MPLTAAAVSVCKCQRQAVSVAALSSRLSQNQSVWRPGCLPYLGRQVMTSIDTAGSQVSESDISATLVSLRERFEAVRRGELQRVCGRLGNLSADQKNAIDSLSHALIERVLQAPMAMLKKASTGNQFVFLLAAVRRIFNL
jgi:glutamyl-tRNA reductase